MVDEFRLFGGDVIRRFNRLPFKNKLIFSGKYFNEPNVIHLKGYDKVEKTHNIFRTKNIFGKRWIDDFDYISYLNSLINN